MKTLMKKKGKAAKAEVWKQYLLNDLHWDVTTSAKHMQRLLSLFKAMNWGYVALAYRLKDGRVRLTKATQVNYASWFNKDFNREEVNRTIPFWDVKLRVWNTFEMENLVDWIEIY